MSGNITPPSGDRASEVNAQPSSTAKKANEVLNNPKIPKVAANNLLDCAKKTSNFLNRNNALKGNVKAQSSKDFRTDMNKFVENANSSPKVK